MRVGSVQALAIILGERYTLLGQLDDFEQSILYYTEAIFLPPHWYTYWPNIAQNLYRTAQLLLLRVVHTIQPEDVKRPVIYLRYLRRQSPEAFNIPSVRVNEMLVEALEIQVGLGLESVMQDIEEMADIFLELLNSDTWTISSDTISSFARTIKCRTGRWGEEQELFAKVIDCLRKAKIGLPESDEISITLAFTLLERYFTSYSNDDYEEGRAILDKILTSSVPWDELSQYREALMVISFFASARLIASQKPEHFEEAIYRFRNWLSWIPLEDPSRVVVVEYLTQLKSLHFEVFGVRDLQEEHPCDSVTSGQPSFWDLIASLESISTDLEVEVQRLSALYSALEMTDAELEGAIPPCRRLFACFQPSNRFKPLAVGILGQLLLRAFDFTNNMEYVNEGISTLKEGINSPNAEHFGVVQFLIHFLSIRFDLRHSREDLSEIMQLYQMAVDNSGTRIPRRFQLSCRWAQLARSHSHPSTPIAYHHALSSMQDSLTFAPTIDIQHSRLVAMRDNYETLPLDCASYQVHIGQLQSAIETLERGRALIWSEMRGLRSSIDQLRTSDSELADKLTAINQDLEVLTLRFAQNNYSDGNGGEGGLEGMDPFGRLVMRQRGMLNDRDKLISQIRTRKGLESFLKPLSFDNLCCAAVRGPVIIINHSRWRSDIIILLHDSPPSLIPTADDFYDRANELRNRLLGARDSEEGPDSLEYEDALCSVLKGLYVLVGRPVIQRLNELHVPEQSRV